MHLSNHLWQTLHPVMRNPVGLGYGLVLFWNVTMYAYCSLFLFYPARSPWWLFFKLDSLISLRPDNSPAPVLQKQVPFQESSQAEPLQQSCSALLRVLKDTFLLGGDWQLPSEQPPLLDKQCQKIVQLQRLEQLNSHSLLLPPTVSSAQGTPGVCPNGNLTNILGNQLCPRHDRRNCSLQEQGSQAIYLRAPWCIFPLLLSSH